MPVFIAARQIGCVATPALRDTLSAEGERRLPGGADPSPALPGGAYKRKELRDARNSWMWCATLAPN